TLAGGAKRFVESQGPRRRLLDPVIALLGERLEDVRRNDRSGHAVDADTQVARRTSSAPALEFCTIRPAPSGRSVEVPEWRQGVAPTERLSRLLRRRAAVRNQRRLER